MKYSNVSSQELDVIPEDMEVELSALDDQLPAGPMHRMPTTGERRFNIWTFLFYLWRCMCSIGATCFGLMTCVCCVVLVICLYFWYRTSVSPYYFWSCAADYKNATTTNCVKLLAEACGIAARVPAGWQWSDGFLYHCNSTNITIVQSADSS